MGRWTGRFRSSSGPLHIHWVTDEAFYVLEGTFVFAPKGLAHTFWNQGPTQARMIVTLSPPGFERYFEELAARLADVGDDAEAAMSVRKALSEKHAIEVVGSPRQATD